MGAPTITHQKHMRPISISMSIWNSIFWVLQNFWNFKTGQLEAKVWTFKVAYYYAMHQVWSKIAKNLNVCFLMVQFLRAPLFDNIG